MKRIFKFLMLIAVVLAVFTGCNPETPQKDNQPTNTIKALTEEQVTPMVMSLVRKEPIAEYSVGAAEASVKDSFKTEMDTIFCTTPYATRTLDAATEEHSAPSYKFESTLNTTNPDFTVYKVDTIDETSKKVVLSIEFKQDNKTGKWQQHNVNDGGMSFDDIYYNGIVGEANETILKEVLKYKPEGSTLFQSWYTFTKEGESKVWDTSMLSIIMNEEQAENCLTAANLTKKDQINDPGNPLLGNAIWETEYTELSDGTYIKMRYLEMPKLDALGREKAFKALLIGISKKPNSYI